MPSWEFYFLSLLAGVFLEIFKYFWALNKSMLWSVPSANVSQPSPCASYVLPWGTSLSLSTTSWPPSWQSCPQDTFSKDWAHFPCSSWENASAVYQVEIRDGFHSTGHPGPMSLLLRLSTSASILTMPSVCSLRSVHLLSHQLLVATVW
jgi:hypothetical protein